MELTREEFYRAIDSLKSDVKEDVGAILSKLVSLEGRAGRGEVVAENHRTRILSLEKTRAKDGPRRRRSDTAGEGEEWASAFTKREYALMSLGFAVVMVLTRVIWFLGDKLWHVLSTAATTLK